MTMIDILLSTYNGEKYLREQLESISSQTYPHFRLLAKDDGSKDKTVSILQEYARKEPRLIWLSSLKEGQGAAKSFWSLLKASSASYVMFADQDDLWLPTKIEDTLHKMQLEESKTPGPVLIHTDMQVIEENRKERSPSFFRYAGIDPEITSIFYRNLVQNGVTGCTMMINKELVDKLPYSAPFMVMHDWWITLAASAFGQVAFLNKPTLLYRQHGLNAVGAKKLSLFAYIRRGVRLKNDLRREQALSFYKTYRDSLDCEKRRKLELFLNTPSLSWIHRKIVFLRERFFWHGLLRNATKFWLNNPF